MSTEETPPDVNDLIKELLDVCKGLNENEANFSSEIVPEKEKKQATARKSSAE